MKRLHFAVGLFATLACSGLKAETVLLANIPFEFQMGKVSFPSGDYIFKYSPHMLTVHQEQGDQATAISLILPTSRSQAPETGLVMFHRYGDIYFLTNLWTPES